jgi:disulfide oxidoreductase YuzD
MKNLITALGLSFGISFVILGPGIGPAFAAAPSPVSVQFINPSKFTDFQIRGRDANYTASHFADSVKEELAPLMKSKYPGASLGLRFTDIDLAGRETTSKNARVMRGEAHPARLAFDFVLADATGKVLAKGSTRLTDNASLSSNRYDPRRSQLFYYERRVLNRWLRTLSPPK